MVDIGLILSRLLHFAAVTTLAGASFFPLYAYAAAEPKELFRWRQAVLLSAAVAALLSGLLWFVFSVSNMSGTFAGVADREALWTVLNETTFGIVWMARLVLSIVTVGLIWIRCGAKFRRDLITPVLAAMLLVSLAGVGHSEIEEGAAGTIHGVSDGAHLLAAGAWLGGLVPLGYILLLDDRERRGRPAQRCDSNEILLRFSGMGYVTVAILIGSGLLIR